MPPQVSNAGEAHQEQVHRVESAELLRYDGVAGGAGVQQGRHQPSDVQARVPEGLLQHAQRRQHGAPLNVEASGEGGKTAKKNNNSGREPLAVTAEDRGSPCRQNQYARDDTNLWRLQKQLVEVREVRLDGQQDAAVDGVAPLEALSVHHAVHPVGGAGSCSQRHAVSVRAGISTATDGATSKSLSHSHGSPDLQQREENLDPVHDAALGPLSRKHILQQLLHALLPAGTQTVCHFFVVFFFIATNIFTE